MRTNREQAAIIYDALLITLVRLDLYPDAATEFLSFAKEAMQNAADSIDRDPSNPDPNDLLVWDVFNRISLHLKEEKRKQMDSSFGVPVPLDLDLGPHGPRLAWLFKCLLTQAFHPSDYG